MDSLSWLAVLSDEGDKLGFFLALAILEGFAFILISVWNTDNFLNKAMEGKENDVASYDKKDYNSTYLSSEATAMKFSSSESTMVSGLMSFLRGLRRGIGRKWEGEWSVKTW